MFVTTPDFEHAVPEILREPDGRYWLAVRLSSQAPFFLVSIQQEEDGIAVVGTVAIAWETTLSTVLQGPTARFVISISRVAPHPSRVGAWVVQEIEQLWLASVGESGKTGAVLCRLAGGSELRDSYESVAHEPGQGRRLLFDARHQQVAMG